MKAKPFLKWAGGKSQLLAQIEARFPMDWQQKIDTYIEPFVGAGALFFEMIEKKNIKHAYISDVNADLILTYKVIQQYPEKLATYLTAYQQEYDKTPQSDRNALFLSVRKAFNETRNEIKTPIFAENWAIRAAQLIFLNKTCFNGLFRLNSKGEFNVPYGEYKTAQIANIANIWAVSQVLANTEIRCADYTACFEAIHERAFVYFDPPYRPLSKTASFTNYAGAEFTDKNQIELAHFFARISKETGAKAMLSNSDPQNINTEDIFFEKIFADYHIHKVSANRAINSKGDKRGSIKELLITNYEYERCAMELYF